MRCWHDEMEMVAGRIDDLVATVQQRSSLGGTASSLIRFRRDFDIVVQYFMEQENIPYYVIDESKDCTHVHVQWT